MSISSVFERIEFESRSLQPARVLLTVIAAPFFGIGWAVGQLFRVTWFVLAWVWTACVVGWRTARGD